MAKVTKLGVITSEPYLYVEYNTQHLQKRCRRIPLTTQALNGDNLLNALANMDDKDCARLVRELTSTIKKEHELARLVKQEQLERVLAKYVELRRRSRTFAAAKSGKKGLLGDLPPLLPTKSDKSLQENGLQIPAKEIKKEAAAKKPAFLSDLPPLGDSPNNTGGNTKTDKKSFLEDLPKLATKQPQVSNVENESEVEEVSEALDLETDDDLSAQEQNQHTKNVNKMEIFTAENNHENGKQEDEDEYTEDFEKGATEDEADESELVEDVEDDIEFGGEMGAGQTDSDGDF